MQEYCRISIKNVILLISYILLFLYLVYLTFQEESEFDITTSNFKSVLKPTKPAINFITKYPNIMPDKCVKTGPFFGGLHPILCLKNPEEEYISRLIDSEGISDQGCINNVIKSMEAYPSAVFLDVGAQLGSYTVVIATMRRKVISVDADSRNLAFIKKSLEIGDARDYVELINNIVSDEYDTLYPYAPDSSNNANFFVYTKEEIEKMDIGTDIIPLNSIKLEDIFNYIESNIVILKIDIESYECKALQPNILLNKLGKFIPYIFIEWKQLPGNNRTCPQFNEWVQHFYDGGYLPYSENMEKVSDDKRDSMIDLVWIHSSAVMIKG